MHDGIEDRGYDFPLRRLRLLEARCRLLSLNEQSRYPQCVALCSSICNEACSAVSMVMTSLHFLSMSTPVPGKRDFL